ncbi:hypothetical protein VTK26DRAFT_8751 [Humicola hyalothermophila]
MTRPAQTCVSPKCASQTWKILCSSAQARASKAASAATSFGGALSPESWARAKQNTSSDIYSFAIMAIYVMNNEMVFHVSEEELRSEMAWWHNLRRHISYFADEAGLEGMLGHIGAENPFFERLIALAEDFDAERPRQSFALWHYVEPDFRDLVGKMANLDPNRRITASQALGHPWFKKAEM